MIGEIRAINLITKTNLKATYALTYLYASRINKNKKLYLLKRHFKPLIAGSNLNF